MTAAIDLHQGDCLEWLRTLPDNSVDLAILDPPYIFKSTNGGGALAVMPRNTTESSPRYPAGLILRYSRRYCA